MVETSRRPGASMHEITVSFTRTELCSLVAMSCILDYRAQNALSAKKLLWQLKEPSFE